jgi:hypothetical protein
MRPFLKNRWLSSCIQKKNRRKLSDKDVGRRTIGRRTTGSSRGRDRSYMKNAANSNRNENIFKDKFAAHSNTTHKRITRTIAPHRLKKNLHYHITHKWSQEITLTNSESCRYGFRTYYSRPNKFRKKCYIRPQKKKKYVPYRYYETPAPPAAQFPDSTLVSDQSLEHRQTTPGEIVEHVWKFKHSSTRTNFLFRAVGGDDIKNTVTSQYGIHSVDFTIKLTAPLSGGSYMICFRVIKVGLKGEEKTNGRYWFSLLVAPPTKIKTQNEEKFENNDVKTPTQNIKKRIRMDFA